MARRLVFVCGDLHNLGDLKLLLQNLALSCGDGGLVRRWAALPPEIERQVAAAGGELIAGRRILGCARRCYGAEIVFGGGQLVRDNVSCAALFGLWLAVISARLGGGRLTTRGLGISRIRSAHHRFWWRRILGAAKTIHVRDTASAENLKTLLPNKDCAVHADMVLLETGTGPAVEALPRAQAWLVIAPCADGSEGRSFEGAATDAIVRAAVTALPGVHVVIACHDPRAHMDKAVAARLVSRWSDLKIGVHDGYDLEALCRLYRNAALVITNRLHALIFAILADAPVIAVDDGTAKVRSVADPFAVPVRARDDTGDGSAQVQQALAYDRAARQSVREEMARRAAGNLTV